MKKNRFLPKRTGVYIFRDKKKIIYIGKAVNLQERIKSHFSQPSYRDNFFIGKVTKIDFIETDSEIEALILEAELIKKHQPDYNVIWKDDKNYFYVVMTEEKFPRILVTHRCDENSSRHIGPFVDGRALKQTLKTLRKVFPYRTCRILPRQACLWYHLDRCPAPCLINSKISGFEGKIKQISQENARNLMKILRGKKPQVLRDLKREMSWLAKKEKFEEAGKIKNQIISLEKILSHSKVFDLMAVQSPSNIGWPYKRAEAYDISNIQGTAATGAMAVFTNGKPDKSQYRKFRIKMENKPNDTAMLKEVLLRRLKHPEWPYPDFMLIDGGKAQLNAATQVIQKSRRSDLRDLRVASLAKKKNELFWTGRKNPVLLKNTPQEFSNIILQLRDEAHRFAKKYHHHLRSVNGGGMIIK